MNGVRRGGVLTQDHGRRPDSRMKQQEQFCALFESKDCNCFGASPRQSVFTATLLLAILTMGAVVRIAYGTPLNQPDEFAYIQAALDINDVGLTDASRWLTNIYANRLSICLPLAAFLRLFGPSETGIASYCLIVSLLAVVVTFWLGCVVGGRIVGLCAAAFVSLPPQIIWLSLTTLPDNHIPLYTAASPLCLLLGMRSQKKTTSYAWFVASGFFLVLAFQARATCGVMLAPLGLTALLGQRRRCSAAIVPGGTFVVSMALITIVLYVFTWDPIIQFRFLTHDAVGTRWTGTGKPFEHVTNMIPVLAWASDWSRVADALQGKSLWFIWPLFFAREHGLFFYLAFVALFYSACRAFRDERFRPPVLMFGLLYLFLSLGPQV